ncbi:alpha-ketoacid dehydrogenase subunit beta [Actinotalea subterranea]|uniref:alpha-ketoacid dehydrogenase subunit beta n=1 Tax=Actinotalea subterranea TaxID=2607497 RepID=UPI0011EFD635|nr:alpha-ketoacid dehydrogenase subunit beta [Actinotalea subterranea]
MSTATTTAAAGTSTGSHAAPATGPSTSTVQRLTLAKAINVGLRASLEQDPKVMLMGEDIGQLGGVFRVTDGLQKDFGPDRVVDTPLAESGIVGTAIGLALRGYRPVCEIQFDGFIFPAFDQITTQLAKMHYRSRGRLSLPVVIRVPYGGGIGAVEHHSESPEVLFAHTAGLRVVSPATPADAFTMIQEAIASPDPVLFFEPKGRYWDKGDVDLSHAYGTSDAAGLDHARIARPGTDLTLVAYGPTVATALRAADAAAADGTSIEVVDLRTISPLDTDTVAESVRRTGRCVVVHEAPVLYGTGAEVAARISEACFFHLEAPVLRVGGFHSPYPVARLEHEYLPSLDRVLDAVDRALAV